MITDAMIDTAIQKQSRDRYGQVPVRNKTPHALFPGREEELRQALKTSKKYALGTYGDRWGGTYEAVYVRYDYKI